VRGRAEVVRRRGDRSPDEPTPYTIGAGCRLQVPGVRDQGLGVTIQGAGFKLQGLGFRV